VRDQSTLIHRWYYQKDVQQEQAFFSKRKKGKEEETKFLVSLSVFI
jgi:hypothetical protein